MHNVTKRANVGTLIRSCAAFSCDMFIIGSREFNTFGSHGSDLYVRVGHAPSVNDAVVELKERRGVEIVGVEIDERAINLYDFEWRLSLSCGTCTSPATDYTPGQGSAARAHVHTHARTRARRDAARCPAPRWSRPMPLPCSTRGAGEAGARAHKSAC